MLLVSCILQWQIVTCGKSPIIICGLLIHRLLSFLTNWYHMWTIALFRYTGLRHDDSDEAVQKKHVWRRDSILDHPLSLDYLPYLRAIAHHERTIRRKVEDMMTENGDASRSGRRTRTSRKNIHRHYLDECAGGQDKTIEGKALELADKYMIVE
jgi:hypothetical protein